MWTALDQPCDFCSARNIPCGEKENAIHYRTKGELLGAKKFIRNVSILEQAHKRIAWVFELSTLPNVNYPPHPTSRSPLLTHGQTTTSVSEEVASLLFNQFMNADEDLITTIVAEEIDKYEKATNDVGRPEKLLGPPTFDDPRKGFGILSSNCLCVNHFRC